MQNTLHAVMAQRTEGKCSLDDFPTPPWATRALVENAIDEKPLLSMTCSEPACGRGHMSVALTEHFAEVHSSAWVGDSAGRSKWPCAYRTFAVPGTRNS
jgi:hypothetical protein